MTIAYFCIVIIFFIPLLCAGYAKFSVKGYDNRQPREFLDKLQGKAKRAHYAQLNTLENFAPFAVGILIAHQLHAPQKIMDILAMSFVCFRILYVLFYISDQHILRSIVWFLGFLITISLFFIGT